MVVRKLPKGIRVTGQARVRLLDEAAAEYEEGRSIRELAEMYDRSYGFVYRLLETSGTPRRGRGGGNRAT